MLSSTNLSLMRLRCPGMRLAKRMPSSGGWRSAALRSALPAAAPRALLSTLMSHGCGLCCRLTACLVTRTPSLRVRLSD